MTRSFIELPTFTRLWKENGFTDDDLLQLQQILLENPESGVMMQGTGGIRKLRFSLPNQGKSGSVRVCYVDFKEFTLVYLLTVYPKNAKDNLNSTEKNALRKIVKILKEESANYWRKNEQDI